MNATTALAQTPVMTDSSVDTLEADGFDAITLEALVSEAELLTRVDRKYVLPRWAAAEAMSNLDPACRVLDINGRRSFHYESVYFDTDTHECYLQNARKRRRRFKLRTRSYVDTGGCFLEVKTKDGRGSTVKQRIAWDSAGSDELTDVGRDFAAEVLRTCEQDAEIVADLSAALISRYHRTTVLLPTGSRATFDTAMNWELLDGSRVSWPGSVIVESKSVGRASELDRALWRAGHRPVSVSKFGVGTAALDPALPRGSWSRLLRQTRAHYSSSPQHTPTNGIES